MLVPQLARQNCPTGCWKGACAPTAFSIGVGAISPDQLLSGRMCSNCFSNGDAIRAPTLAPILQFITIVWLCFIPRIVCLWNRHYSNTTPLDTTLPLCWKRLELCLNKTFWNYTLFAWILGKGRKGTTNETQLLLLHPKTEGKWLDWEIQKQSVINGKCCLACICFPVLVRTDWEASWSFLISCWWLTKGGHLTSGMSLCSSPNNFS